MASFWYRDRRKALLVLGLSSRFLLLFLTKAVRLRPAADAGTLLAAALTMSRFLMLDDDDRND
jgi:hypothetical protein